ncbi:MAG: hypothetical protein AAGC53_14510 [Actinomycetota bacterium]
MGIRRVRALRPDAAIPSEAVWGEELAIDGVSFRESAEPGPAREAAIEEIKEVLRHRASGLEGAAEDLRALLAKYEPVEFVTAIAAPTSMGMVGPAADLLEDGAQTHTWPAKIEYLLGLALSVSPGTASTPTSVTERAMHLLADVFDAAHARRMIESFDAPSHGSFALDKASFLLRQEQLTDRMPGYPVHVEQIDAEVFDRHRDFYIDTVGFNPADVTRVVRRRARAVSVRFNLAREQLRAAHSSDDEPQQADALAALLLALDESRLWSASSVARDTDVGPDEIAAMLRTFSTTFGSQPNFRLPTDLNLASTRPCVRLHLDGGADETYFVADVWALSSAVHRRLADELEGAGRERYQRHREQGNERLVHTAFAKVFGPAAYANLHFVSADGPGEVDELVVSGWPLVAEAKAHSLTSSGRRGAPKRVHRVAKSTVGEAMGQTARVVNYVIDHDGRTFSRTQQGESQTLLPRDVIGIERIVVTFERMDPLALEAAGIVGEPQQTWTVCIADLLMLTDVLADPASFHHYARRRRQTLQLGITIYTEADALGGYLLDRLAAQVDLAQRNPDTSLVLGYTSWALNDYYNRVEFGLDGPPLSTGVPDAVSAVLADAIEHESGGAWIHAVDAVMDAPIDIWKRWRRFARRHRSTTTKTFALGDRVKLAIGPAAVTRNDDSVTIVVPPASRSAERPR